MHYLIWAIGAPLITGAICFCLGYYFGLRVPRGKDLKIITYQSGKLTLQDKEER